MHSITHHYKKLLFLTLCAACLTALFVVPVLPDNGGQSAQADALQGTPNFRATFAPTLTARADGKQFDIKNARETAAVIESYALEVLGREVEVIDGQGIAANLDVDLTETLEILLEGWVDLNSVVADLSAEAYIGVLRGGLATVNFGSALAEGDVSADIQGASFAAFGLNIPRSDSLDADSALALALETYPALAALRFTPYEVSIGFAWYAEGRVEVTDRATGRIVQVEQRVVVFASQRRVRATVAAVVARGDFADFITPR
jgi:hypothetical protein